MSTDKIAVIALAVLLAVSAAMSLVSVINANQATDKINNLFCIEAQ
ncbi:hypothetical protein ACQR1W_31355 [Bradyrhizobium sp. HKCCYLS1011]